MPAKNRIVFLAGVCGWLTAAALRAQSPEPPPAPPPPEATASGASSEQVTSGTSFNPSISIIPDAVYYNDSVDGGGLDLLGHVDGFGSAHGHEDADQGHSHGLDLDRGFNLRETEVTFSGTVDPYFDVWAILAASLDGIDIEESYVLTRRLPAGLKLKAGKFYSEIGYVNKQHPHQWDLTDQALPYQLLLGGSLNEVGVQLSWLPSLPVYALVGVEALQGENEGVSAYHGSAEDVAGFRDKGGPRLATAFVKLAPDLGYDHALQIGAFATRSWLHQQEWEPFHEEDAHEHEADDEDELHDDALGEAVEALEGTTWLLGTDGVYKHDSSRPYGRGDIQVQAEYLYRVKDLDVVAGPHDEEVGAKRRFVQDGLYAQLRYGFAPRWSATARFDATGIVNRLEAPGAYARDWGDSTRVTLALTFNPTEFSRLRAQYSHSALSVDGERRSFDQVYVQYQMSLGAHGAHPF